MITSTDNNKIKDVCRLIAKKKERYSRQLFVAEGEKQVFEAPNALVESVFCTEEFENNHKDRLNPEITETVSERVFAKMSDTDTPQGILALVRMRTVALNDIYKAESSPLILFLEDIRDPGNLGTIVRSAEAAGVTGIIMSEGTADIYSPKTVRSTMGSIYRVPFVYTGDFKEELKANQKRGIRLFAAYLDESSTAYGKVDYTSSCGIIIGNEASGLDKETAELADEKIIIPMCGQVESLNAAMAATLIAFEARRQRQLN